MSQKPTRKEFEDEFRRKWLRGSDCQKYPTEVVINEFGTLTWGNPNEPTLEEVEPDKEKSQDA